MHRSANSLRPGLGRYFLKAVRDLIDLHICSRWSGFENVRSLAKSVLRGKVWPFLACQVFVPGRVR